MLIAAALAVPLVAAAGAPFTPTQVRQHPSSIAAKHAALLFLLGAIIGVVVQEPNLNGDYLLSGVGKDAGKTVKNEKFPTHCEEHTLPPPSLSHRTQLTSNSHRQTRTTPAAWSTSTSTRL